MTAKILTFRRRDRETAMISHPVASILKMPSSYTIALRRPDPEDSDTVLISTSRAKLLDDDRYKVLLLSDVLAVVDMLLSDISDPALTADALAILEAMMYDLTGD